MGTDLFFDNKKYISVKKASSLSGYSRDYIGQLCRENKIDSKRIDRAWYVAESSTLTYKNYSPEPLVSVKPYQPSSENILSRPTEILKPLYNKGFPDGQNPSSSEASSLNSFESKGASYLNHFLSKINFFSVNSSVKGKNTEIEAVDDRQNIAKEEIVEAKNFTDQFSNSINVSNKIEGNKKSRLSEILKYNENKGLIKEDSKTNFLNDSLKPPKESDFSKYKHFLHELVFVQDLGFSRKLLSLTLSIIFTLGLFSIGSNLRLLPSAIYRLPITLNELSQVLEKEKISLLRLSQKISSIPNELYGVSEEVAYLYTDKFLEAYLYIGEKFVSDKKFLLSEANRAKENPSEYLLNNLKSLSLKGEDVVNEGVSLIVKFISSSRHGTLSFISESDQGFTRIKSMVTNYVKNNSSNGKNLAALTVGGVESQTNNPINKAGLTVYTKVNSWIDRGVYIPFVNFFSTKPTPVNTVYVVTKEKETKSAPAATAKETSKSQTPVVPKSVNTTNVIERVIERQIPSDLSKAYLETRLEELNNKILSKLFSLSTGSGGNITNVYQQIAHSQRIDNLSGTNISNPTITGGSINGTSVSATTFGVSSTGTSTFSGGISVTGDGCVSVNGVCLGTGSGGLVSFGPLNQTSTGPNITLATTTSTTNGLISGLNIVGSGTTMTFTPSLSGTLTTAGGGTGWASLQTNTVLLGNGAGAISTTSAGTDGFTLALVGGVPTWTATTTLANISGTLSVAKGGTGQTSFGQGWINFDGSSLNSSTSPTVNYITATSTTATSTFAGGFNITKGLQLNSGYVFGAGLTTCSAVSGKITWDSVTGQFGCGADAGAGGGITSLGAQYSTFQTGASQTFATSSDTNLNLTITSSGDIHTFTPVWTGTLALSRGGTNSTSFANNSIITSNSNGTSLIATGTQLTVGNILATSTTGISNFLGSVGLSSSTPFGRFSVNPVAGDSIGFVVGSSTATQLSVSSLGFGTTTLSGLNIVGLATSTSNVGYNIVAGCYAVGGICVGTNDSINSFIHSSTTIPKLYTANLFTQLQTFPYSSSTIYSSFLTSSSTFANVGTLALHSTLNGPLQANAGVVSATTTVGVLYGGTGLTSYVEGDILYGNSGGGLSKLPLGGDGLVLKVNAGFPSWQTDITSGGGGGATAWSTTTNSMIIYPTDTSDILVLGSNATTTTGNIFEIVSGNSLFGGNVKINGNASSTLFSSNVAYFGGTATSTFTNSGYLGIGSSTPWGLLSVNPNALGSGIPEFVIGSSTATRLLIDGKGFIGIASTTPRARLGIETQAGDLIGFAVGSTTKNLLSVSTEGFGTTTLSGLSISGFATSTSNVGFSITSGCYAIGSTCIGSYGDSNVNSFIHSSTTIPKLYTANVFTQLQTFTNSSSTLGSFTYASTTELRVGSGQGYGYIGSNGLFGVTSTSTLANYILPFTSYGASTSTTLGLTGGFFSTASSTFGSTLFLPSLTTGFAFTGTNGIVSTISTSTLAGQVFSATTFPINSIITSNASGNLIATTSQLTVGNLLSTTTATSYFLGNVGVGTTTPWGQLSINPNALGSGVPEFVIGSSSATRLAITGKGNVLIGTSTIPTNASSSQLFIDLNALRSWGATFAPRGVEIYNSPSSLTYGGGAGDNNELGGAFVINSTQGSGNTYAPAINIIQAGVSKIQINQPGTILATSNLSASIPTYSFIGDVDTGLYTAVANTLAFATGGSEAARLTATTFGLGTTTPTNNLTIASTTGPQLSLSAGGGLAQWTFRNAGGNLYIATTTVAGTATTSTSALEIAGGGFGTTTVRGLSIANAQATSTSNVGFSITTGCYAIGSTCVGGGGFTNTLASGGTATTTFYSGGVVFASSTGAGLLSQSSQAANFFWDETNKRLGLGTAVPGYSLDVQGTTPIINLQSSSGTGVAYSQYTNNGGVLYVGREASTGGFLGSTDPYASVIATGGYYGLQFAINTNLVAMTIASTTFVGVGTTTPWAKLSVNPDALGSGVPEFVVGSSSATHLVVDGGGNVGIGLVNPAYPLEIKGSGVGGALLRLIDNEAGLNTIFTPGSMTFNTAGANGTIGTNSGNLILSPASNVGIATTTPIYPLTIASTSQPQLSLSAGAGFAQTVFRNDGTNLYIATTTVAGTATTSISALEIALGGFGTTTIRGLTIANAQATSTSNVGFSITNGCFARGTTCLSLSTLGGTVPLANGGTNSTSFAVNSIITSNSAGTALIATGTQLTVGNLIATTTATSYFLGNVGVGTTTTPFLNGISQLTIATSTTPQLSLSDSAGIAQWTFRNAGGNLYIATTTVAGTSTSTLPALTILNSKSLTGIASTSPWGLLSINPNALGSGIPEFVVGSSTITRFVIEGGGDVGIGTRNPNVHFQMNNSTGGELLLVRDDTTVTVDELLGSFAFDGNDGNIPTTISNAGASIEGYAAETWSTTDKGSYMVFRTADIDQDDDTLSPERMRLTATGLLGIGTTTPNPLGIFDIASVTPVMFITDTNATAGSKHWGFFNNDNIFSIGTSSDTFSATSSAFSISAPTAESPGTTVGIATTSPWRTLSVVGTMGVEGLTLNTGAATASVCLSSTNEFTRNTDAETCIASSERYKKNINQLTLGLDEVMQMKPISFEYKELPGEHFGFIAEDMAEVSPLLVSVDDQNLPNGIRWTHVTSIAINAIQEMNLNIESIASTTPLIPDSFGDRFMQGVFARLTDWLALATNNIGNLFADAIYAKEEICVDDQCLSKDDVRTLIEVVRTQGSTGEGSSTPPTGDGTASSTPDTTSPVITINGNNPAEIIVGSSYADLGATVTDTNENGEVNNNLGLHFSVNDVDVTDISLDTSTTTVYTIIYSSVDAAGNIGTATRIVNVITQ